MPNLYLYLTRRDKTSFKLLSIFSTTKIFSPTRIVDITKMGLPASVEAAIASSVRTDRMLWEPWIESANSYNDLKKSLESRDFRGIPSYSIPQHMPNPGVNEVPTLKAPIDSRTTMLRKRKN